MVKATSTHLSDEELLLFAARELSTRAATQAQIHLAECGPCRMRSGELEGALRETGSLTGSASSPDGLRSRLVSEMRDRQTLKSAGLQSVFRVSAFSRIAFSCLILFVLVLAGRSNYLHRPMRGVLFPAQTATLPIKTLTPGVTQPIALIDLCSAQASTARVPIDDSVARQVFEEYGLSFTSRKAYEVDYLITPGLGGSSDIRNLWPEPDESTDWNAHVKDVLEDHLHDLVCEGKLPLATAQYEISGDWIAAYKKHFHTERPLQNSVSRNASTKMSRAG